MVKRILSLDGGGVRGVITLQLLRHIEETYNIVLHEHFDMFAGTSTGALIASLIAYKKMSAGEILDNVYTPANLKDIMYQSYYDKWFGIFQYKPKYSDKGKQDLINKFLLGKEEQIAAVKPEKTDKKESIRETLKEEIKKELKEELKREICLELSMCADKQSVQLDEEVRSDTILSDIGSQKQLKENIHTMYCVKKHLLITAYDPSQKKPIFFRNYFNMPNFCLADVCNSTSAAPTYFPAAKVTNLDDNVTNWYIDGGICNNNPANMAYIDMKKLYPNEHISLLSLGTGISKSSFDPNKDSNIGGIEWIFQDNIIDTVLDGNQLMSHLCVEELSKENKDKYLRVNKYLKLCSGKIDDTTDINYQFMVKEGTTWWEKSKTDLHEFFFGNTKNSNKINSD